MDYPTTYDANKIIENFEQKAKAMRDKHEAQAAEIRAEPQSGWPEMDRATEAKAKEQDLEAARWNERARVAEKAKRLVVHDDDSKFVMGHQHVVNTMESEARAIHVPHVGHEDVRSYL